MTARKNKIVRVEIVAPNEGPQRKPEEKLRELVQREVAKVLANRDDFILQPFFQARKVSDEISRLQTVPELKKWAVYHARFGCLICKTKKTGHVGCGMCQNCASRTRHRLEACVKTAEKLGQDWRKEFVDHADLARQALAGLTGVAGKRRLKAAKHNEPDDVLKNSPERPQFD